MKEVWPLNFSLSEGSVKGVWPLCFSLSEGSVKKVWPLPKFVKGAWSLPKSVEGVWPSCLNPRKRRGLCAPVSERGVASVPFLCCCQHIL